MIDGTGTTSYTYDQLDRLTESVNGHKESIGYEYDLTNELTKITYPNKDSVARTYDGDGRLQTVTDWLGHQTKFSYNANSDLIGTTFPISTGDQDKYAYDNADEMSEVKMTKGAETLASLAYTRDNDGQVKTTVSKGLPGEEKIGDTYDSNSRLIKAGTLVYGYDGADNPTKLGSGVYTYDNADELKAGNGVKFAYNEVGQRVKSTPNAAATTYGYDQAGNVISVEVPTEGKVAAIKDAYTYDGDNLRASQTKAGKTSYMAWDAAEGLPLPISDGTNSYVYGPEGLPVEQINGESKVLYLHHDQQGSTRMLTGSSGKAEGTMTYDPYGNTTGTTGSVATPLGYDAQYVSGDTGLIYLRARTYDPKTAQFLSVDSLEAFTRAPYSYASDNPVNYRDRRGTEGESIGEGVSCPNPLCFPLPTHETAQHAAEAINSIGHEIGHGAESIWHAIAGEGGSSDEDEQAEQGENACIAGEELIPPGYNPDTWTKAPASRPSDSGENIYDPEGGEWRWHAPDKYHPKGHWDHKGPGKFAPWENIYPEEVEEG